jgi:hypothetical protein
VNKTATLDFDTEVLFLTPSCLSSVGYYPYYNSDKRMKLSGNCDLHRLNIIDEPAVSWSWVLVCPRGSVPHFLDYQ